MKTANLTGLTFEQRTLAMIEENHKRPEHLHFDDALAQYTSRSAPPAPEQIDAFFNALKEYLEAEALQPKFLFSGVLSTASYGYIRALGYPLKPAMIPEMGYIIDFESFRQFNGGNKNFDGSCRRPKC